MGKEAKKWVFLSWPNKALGKSGFLKTKWVSFVRGENREGREEKEKREKKKKMEEIKHAKVWNY